MAKSPAFQFYPRDWLSSPKVMLMTPAEEGAYIRLLAYCWDSGDCSLPDDDKLLAVLSRLGDDWNGQAMAKLRGCMISHPTKAGSLTNDRLYQEMVKQDDFRTERSLAGTKGAIKRWNKRNKRRDGKRKAEPKLSHDLANGKPMANDSSSSSSSLSSLSEKMFECFWKAYPRRVAKANAAKSFENLKPDETLTAAIVAGVERWKRSQDWSKDKGQFIPYPATFLNQRRWEEDPSPETLRPPPAGERVAIENGVKPAWAEERSGPNPNLSNR